MLYITVRVFKSLSQTILALHDAECVDVVRDFRSILSFKNLTFLRPFCCVVKKFLSIVKKTFYLH